MSNRVTVDGKTHLWPHNLKNVLKLLKKIGNNAELFRTGMSFKEADLAQNQHSYEKVFSGERRPKALKNWGNRGTNTVETEALLFCMGKSFRNLFSKLSTQP